LSPWAKTSTYRDKQGQQFFPPSSSDDNDDNNDDNNDDKNLEKVEFINYGEFFGKAVTIQVKGYGYRNLTSSTTTTTTTKIGKESKDDDSATKKGFFSTLLGRLSKKNDDNEDGIASSNDSNNSEKTQQTKNLLTCPVDYNVVVTGGYLRIFDNPFQLTFYGPGITRVLYADPNLRIFISPGNQVEKKGTVVAQVRIDLLEPNFDGAYPIS